MGLLIWQFMTETGKNLHDLIEEIYDITGRFAFERADLKINPDLKLRIIDYCREGRFTSFGKYKVRNVDTLDGFKYYLNDSEWVMIRPSGTEPVLRTYAESETTQQAKDILKACYDTIMSI
jgi:phosphomannomutase